MSAVKRQAEAKKEQKQPRKALLNAPGSGSDEDTSEVSWESISAETIQYVVTAVADAGGVVMLMRSQDGGALGARVLHDDHQKVTRWGRPDEGFEDRLLEIAKYYSDYAEKGGTE